jgi:hypothetical protein
MQAKAIAATKRQLLDEVRAMARETEGRVSRAKRVLALARELRKFSTE